MPSDLIKRGRDILSQIKSQTAQYHEWAGHAFGVVASDEQFRDLYALLPEIIDRLERAEADLARRQEQLMDTAITIGVRSLAVGVGNGRVVRHYRAITCWICGAPPGEECDELAHDEHARTIEAETRIS